MDEMDRARELVSSMTLAEKASLLSGADKWHTKTIERLHLDSVMVADGPHGLRKECKDPEKGVYTAKATCFPTACATACSFDRDLLYRIGGRARRGVLRGGCGCVARSGAQLQTQPALRTQLRILQRRPRRLRRTCRRLHQGRAESRCRYLDEALRTQQSGVSPPDH